MVGDIMPSEFRAALQKRVRAQTCPCLVFRLETLNTWEQTISCITYSRISLFPWSRRFPKVVCLPRGWERMKGRRHFFIPNIRDGRLTGEWLRSTIRRYMITILITLWSTSENSTHVIGAESFAGKFTDQFEAFWLWIRIWHIPSEANTSEIKLRSADDLNITSCTCCSYNFPFLKCFYSRKFFENNFILAG